LGGGVRLGMQINLEPSDLKVLIKLLGMAGDEFSNHGCNDFHLLKDGGLAPGEAEAMKTRMQVEFPGEEEAFDRDIQYDWLLMRRFQRVFENALKRVQQ
jgi:hypothetical protein